ncbi:hypothetical protein DPMN_115417 [Dreissena polymorpha]|uniref:Uncharacterized protein n=1 Tax=Dreissena polymorpha TaxID=45954 RepID=A0A9D4KLU0_DREPO|nr:hypothetical protein DPMN_115417 [Dreissena polymorpha]
MNVTSRVVTRKNAPPPGDHVFHPTGTNFELVQDLIGTYLLTKFNEDRAINVPSKVLTRQMLTPHDGQKGITKAHQEHFVLRVLTRKNVPPPRGHVFQQTSTIFKLIQYIMKTYVLAKFYDNKTINMTSRVLTRVYYSHIRKTTTLPGCHVFQPTGTIFELVQDIIGTRVVTKFLKDCTINVSSRVLTM